MRNRMIDRRSTELQAKSDYSRVELMGRTLLSSPYNQIDELNATDPSGLFALMDCVVAVLDAAQDVGINDADCDLLFALDHIEAVCGSWQAGRFSNEQR